MATGGLQDTSGFYPLLAVCRVCKGVALNRVRAVGTAKELAMTMAIDSSAEAKLAQFGLTEEEVERLVEALGHENQQTRCVIRGALKGLGEAAVPALERALSHSDSQVR